MANTQNPRQGRVGLSSLLTKQSVTRYMKKIAQLLLSGLGLKKMEGAK